MKKIIVTGGLGFIGSNLVELLLKKNFYVINIDKVTYSSNFYNTKEFKKSKKYKFIKCKTCANSRFISCDDVSYIFQTSSHLFLNKIEPTASYICNL